VSHLTKEFPLGLRGEGGTQRKTHAIPLVQSCHKWGSSIGAKKRKEFDNKFLKGEKKLRRHLTTKGKRKRGGCMPMGVFTTISIGYRWKGMRLFLHYWGEKREQDKKIPTAGKKKRNMT